MEAEIIIMDNEENQKAEALRWFREELLPSYNGNMSRACAEVDISAKTMKALLAGEYKGNVRGMVGKLAEARAALAPRLAVASLDLDCVRTGIMERIHAVCDAAKVCHMLNYVAGRSQMGKTTALTAYAERWPETTVYFRMPTRPTVAAMLYELLEACGLPTDGTPAAAMRRARRHLTKKHLVIVDEAHAALYRRDGVDCLDCLRELFDNCGCGMVLAVTDEGARDIVRGAHAVRLLQVEKRGEWTILPENPKNVDLRAIWEAYGLGEPSRDVQQEIGAMVRASCLGQFCRRLKVALLEARAKGCALTWEDFSKVAARMGRRPQ